MKILVTGGAGFIGSNFVRLLLGESSHHVINLDALTYAGNPENLKDVEDHDRYSFIKGDIRDRGLLKELFAGGPDAVVNFAAESHVDRSIESPAEFLETNVTGTAALLDAAREFGLGLFLQVSTDEVYGSLGEEELSTEESPLLPNSPYAASKAAADCLVRAYHRTYGVPSIITRSSNNYGPFQFPEKVIPLFVTNAMEDKPLPLYGDGGNSRDWIHVEDNCRAILLALEEGTSGEVYNIGGDIELKNIDLARRVLKILGKPDKLITYVEDRPGHDRRYCLDSTKIESELGFSREYDFDAGLAMTVKWFENNRQWWKNIKSGDYRDYYERMYGGRLKKPRKPGGK